MPPCIASPSPNSNSMASAMPTSSADSQPATRRPKRFVHSAVASQTRSIGALLADADHTRLTWEHRASRSLRLPNLTLVLIASRSALLATDLRACDSQTVPRSLGGLHSGI